MQFYKNYTFFNFLFNTTNYYIPHSLFFYIYYYLDSDLLVFNNILLDYTLFNFDFTAWFYIFKP